MLWTVNEFPYGGAITAGGADDGDDVSAPVVVFAVVDVVFLGVGGIPHIFDSVELTNLSFGLLGLHIAAFCCAVRFPWPWAVLKFRNSINTTDTILVARIMVMDIDIMPRYVPYSFIVPMSFSAVLIVGIIY